MRTPKLQHPRSMDVTPVVEWRDGVFQSRQDALVGEEPLEIRLGEETLTVTMRTPGHDEELAAGLLLSEGIVRHRGQIRSLAPAAGVKPTERGNVFQVELEPGAPAVPHALRNFLSTSACGICGKASIDSVRLRCLERPNRDFRVSGDALCTYPAALQDAQHLFGQTGALHAAGLFDAAGRLIVLREDVGRHNAVDKVIGWALLEGLLPLSRHVLLVSGRGGFELVQKAIVGGIPVMASVSAPSSLAVRLARELGLTLVGFLRGRRFIVYAGEERIAPAPAGVVGLAPPAEPPGS